MDEDLRGGVPRTFHVGTHSFTRRMHPHDHFEVLLYYIYVNLFASLLRNSIQVVTMAAVAQTSRPIDTANGILYVSPNFDWYSCGPRMPVSWAEACKKSR